MRYFLAVVLPLVAFAGFLPQYTLAQNLDSLLITYTQYTRITGTGNPYTNCQSEMVGSHPDVIGNGNDHDYTYFFNTSSTRGDGYIDDTPTEWTGVSEDIPGVVITFQGGNSSSSVLNGDCTSTFEGHAEAWAGFTVYVHFPEQPNQPPYADFTWSASQTQFFTVDFDATNSEDPDGEIVSYAWDFGDGSTGSGVSPSHTYAKRGTYEVTLTVTDDEGATGVRSEEIAAEGPDLRYVVSLALHGDGAGKRLQDGDTPQFQVGDTVRVQVAIENTGDVPLEEIHLPDSSASIEVTTEPEEALMFVRAEQEEIAVLAVGKSDTLVYLFEAVAETNITVSVYGVEAQVVDPDTGEQVSYTETETACTFAGKSSKLLQDDEKQNVTCAQGTTTGGFV